jgi:hypothetical protein
MKLFYWSNQDFDTADLPKSRDWWEFGRSFYITTMLWAESAEFIIDEYYRKNTLSSSNTKHVERIFRKKFLVTFEKLS